MTLATQVPSEEDLKKMEEEMKGAEGGEEFGEEEEDPEREI